MRNSRSMKRLTLLAFAGLLAACDESSVVGPPNAAAPAVLTGAPVPPSILSPAGWGPVRIGTTEAKAIEAMGGGRATEPVLGSTCHYVRPLSSGSIRVMIENGKVSRIEAHGGADHVVTDTGLSLGATPDQVRARYSGELDEEPDKYLPAPAATLTWWNRRENIGIRYLVNSAGLVDAIFVGGSSIRNVEGCS